MIEIRRLPGRPADWDRLIAGYDTKTLFHEGAWLDHVLSIHPDGRIDYFELLDGGARVGLHCGLRVTRMGLPIHGTPLGGTGTNYMGPLVSPDVDQRALARAIRSLMGPRNGLHMEVSHFAIDDDAWVGAGFERHASVTHLVRLPDDEEEAWAGMKGTCRNRVRKARKNELIVEQIDDVSIADRFFEQFIEVYGKQGMRTPFGPDRPRSLFTHLHPAGRILPLQIRSGDEVVATGLFPFDDRCIYFWGAASWLRHQKLCPNELLHWEVIRFAVERGLKAYNMCGGQSRFKDKFGGEDVPYVHYSKSALPGLRTARKLYRRWHFARLRRVGGEG